MAYTAIKTSLPGVLILEPECFGDARGFFLESFNARDFARATGQDVAFVQDNHSRSRKGVLRGLHYQVVRPQGKLIWVVTGEIFDVAVDLRRSSATCRQWVGVTLSESNHRQLWVPPGFAHGFLVLSDVADVAYKTTEYWFREHDRSLRWDDPTLGIEWPLAARPILAAKDAEAPEFDSDALY